MKRRDFVHGIVAGSMAGGIICRPSRVLASPIAQLESGLAKELDAVLAKPVIDLSFQKEPIEIQSIELLRDGSTYLLRTRSKDGAEVITVPHQAKMATLYPILLKSVIPAFVGKDARNLEKLIWESYRFADNYKLQGLALWVCIAAVEMALLELICHIAKRPLADLFGGRLKTDVAVYFASGNRGNIPEAEVEYLQSLVAQSGAKALKFRLGGRMNRDIDSLPGRSEKLLELARKRFGREMTLYADSNSSYSAKEAVRIGRIMESNDYSFFEEPCEFDDLWGTKQVADDLSIPVAGGEQEYSMHRWRWAILNRGLDIVQPDLHYGGGFLRAVQVARMAEAAGMQVVPHMSGGGLGYVEVVHFASFVRNVGPYMEFKGSTKIPVECSTSNLKAENGVVRCPTGIGFGVSVPKEFVAKCKIVAT